MTAVGSADDLADWHRAGPADDIELDAAIVLPLLPPVAIFHVDGGFFATDDTCTHAESSLAEGYVEDGTVECEFHFAKFDVRTGAALTPPAVTPLRVYPVEVHEGVLYVDLRGRPGCAVEQLKGL
jgi:3-phenylpropionate/trans-cinnamate dioxygenase ferredoxin component